MNKAKEFKVKKNYKTLYLREAEKVRQLQEEITKLKSENSELLTTLHEIKKTSQSRLEKTASTQAKIFKKICRRKGVKLSLDPINFRIRHSVKTIENKYRRMDFKLLFDFSLVTDAEKVIDLIQREVEEWSTGEIHKGLTLGIKKMPDGTYEIRNKYDLEF